MKQRLIRTFFDSFGEGELPRVFFAGGRVNLIGEHTDYNGGHVFPCALEKGTYAAVRLRDDSERLFSSANESKGWTSYPNAVLSALKERGFESKTGFEMLIWGNLPQGAGLSSSASLEVVVCYALNALFGWGLSLIEMAKICQHAENAFVGVNCGILDQFAVAMAKENTAIYLDTDTFMYEYVPLKLQGYELLIFDSKKPRKLVESKYNERRSECQTALKCLKVQALCSLSMAEFERSFYLIDDEVAKKRARHAISENERTKEAVRVLRSGDLARFGQLMNQSHLSLKNDYEVSCFELDALFSLLLDKKGVLGARMTGAGFGGCVIALVEETKAEDIKKETLAQYKKITGLDGACYSGGIGGGPKEL